MPAVHNRSELCSLLHPKRIYAQWFNLNHQNGRLRLPRREGGERLLVTRDSTVQIEEGGSTHLLAPDSVFHCHPELDLWVRATQTGSCRLLDLGLKGELPRDYLNELQKKYRRPLGLPSSENDKQTLIALGGDLEPTSEQVFNWLTGLHQCAHERSANLAKLIAGGPEHLRAIAERNQFSIKAIAQELGCHTTYLSKSWKNGRHPSLATLLREQRLELARYLLSNTDMTIRAVAGRCGYSGSPAFCTAFRQAHKVSPSDWRACQQPSGTAHSKHPTRPTREAAHSKHPTSLKTSSPPRKLESVSQDERPVTVWGKPYFQFAGGEVNFPYLRTYNLTLNTITNAVTWVCTIEGHARMEVEGHCLEVGPGTVVVHPKPMYAKWSTPGGRPWQRIWIHQRDQWSQKAMYALCNSFGWVYEIPLSSPIIEYSRRWVSHWNAYRGTPLIESSKAAYNWLLSWEALLASEHAKPVEGPDMSRYQSLAFFRRIGSINGYAKSVGYSRSYLSRCLKRQWQGGTPAQIVRRHRLAQAAHDLVHSHDSVNVIAERALYANTSAFIYAFKREYSVTPLAYRHRGQQTPTTPIRKKRI